ncbi:heme A synthase [Agaricicola taiwanensis]|uniref:Heme A synthase n=1 Tax=Agaricicola taiwanensis TaxID=591372 RepID=A0A8J2YJC5_9RHOB|nr:COX15/CtaA family protein [Agaricicola taiwanensis]GGE46017.1 heme A synthase [Agaricicola taiwanensis]
MTTAVSSTAIPDPWRGLRIWLWITLALVVVMITIGGATRLTGSGLSITEWRPVTGAIPPLSQGDWVAEFEKYRQSSQYELLNQGMSLGDFKFIYWWEWGHRQLGRLIGLVYLGGFVWAAATRRVSLRQGVTLFAMGLLLGMQGAVGWIMVASGLEPGMTAVAPVKLTLHLGLACLFLASLVVALVRFGAFSGDAAPASSAMRWATTGLFILIFCQVLLGGLVAGSRAGMTFNTWPLMDGQIVPSTSLLFVVQPWWENFIDNPALVQFNHRIGAYLVLIAVVWHALALRKGAPDIRRRARGLMHIVATQVILGIVTLLHVVPLSLGLAHQFLAVVLLIFAVRHATLTFMGAGQRTSQSPRAAETLPA